MITVVTGTDIEKLKGDFESVINGMNMVGKIPYDVYSELFDVGVDCIQKAYELGKSELEKENAELKTKVCLSIDCDKAKKDGELCLGYGGDEDEPCEQCKNCIKCECGYYQLGETDKDEQLTKAKEIIKALLKHTYGQNLKTQNDFDLYLGRIKDAEQFLNSEVEK